jgi:predicted GNAT family acetyltransferase
VTDSSCSPTRPLRSSSGSSPIVRSTPRTLELQHTIISEGFSRRGFARTLVTTVLDRIRNDDGRIVPTCTYVQGYLERFPQYGDLVADQ